MHPILACAVMLALTATAAADVGADGNSVRLRSIISLPAASLSETMSLTMGLDYSPALGYVISRERPDLSVSIQSLQSALADRAADAPGYYRLGALYDAEADHHAAAGAYRKSAACYRRLLARAPGDGRLAAGYSLALLRLGRASDAEAALHRAAPGGAAVEAARAQVEEERADQRLKQGPEAGRAEAAQEALDDAGEAYDRAVVLAPREPTFQALRAGFLAYTRPQMQGRINALRPGRPGLPASFISEAGLADYQRAAELSPKNPYAVAMPVWLDVVCFAVKHHTDMADRANVPRMSAGSRSHARAAILRLKALTQTEDRHRAARAWTALAWVQFEFYGDAGGAVRSLVRALEEDPSRQDAADYLLHVPAVTNNWPLLAAVCRREIRGRDTTRLRVILAYADCKLSRDDEAQRQLEAAHVREPHNGGIALALAALLMKTGSPNDLVRARVPIAQAAPLSSQTLSPERRAEYDALRGIGEALAGQPVQAGDLLRRALEADPANTEAKRALALLTPAAGGD